MFVDKKQWSEVIKEYVVQEGIALRKVKNDRVRHIVVYKDDSCSWRIHVSRLPDEVTWKVKSLKGEHHCARLQSNPTTSYSWMTQQLLTDYKVDPSIKPPRMQQILMEKYGLQAKTHTIRRALNLLKVWFEGSHEDSYALLLELH